MRQTSQGKLPSPPPDMGHSWYTADSEGSCSQNSGTPTVSHVVHMSASQTNSFIWKPSTVTFHWDLCKDLLMGHWRSLQTFLPFDSELSTFPLLVFSSLPAPGPRVHKTPGTFCWGCLWKGDDIHICADPPDLEKWAIPWEQIEEGENSSFL